MNKTKMTKANEDYIEAIYVFEIQNHGEPMKSVDLAIEMNVSRAAINKATNELKEKGLIEKSDYGRITLTELGRNMATQIYHKHLTIKKLLLKLGVSEERAAIECCLIEHVVSDDTIEKISKFVEE